jgi:hypothetical protein
MDAGYASARDFRKRPCEQYWRPWSYRRIDKDAEFSGGD